MSQQSSAVWSPYANNYNPIQVGSIDGTHTEPHDRGIIRACKANYRPNPKLKNKPQATLFVGRLDGDVTEADLKSLFKKHGVLKNVTIIRDIVTGFSKRYGFVEFEDHHDCQKARKAEHKAVLKGKVILVDYECQHTLPGWVPRRLGGGFGGYKESGQLRFGCLDRPWKRPSHETASKIVGRNTPKNDRLHTKQPSISESSYKSERSKTHEPKTQSKRRYQNPEHHQSKDGMRDSKRPKF